MPPEIQPLVVGSHAGSWQFVAIEVWFQGPRMQQLSRQLHAGDHDPAVHRVFQVVWLEHGIDEGIDRFRPHITGAFRTMLPHARRHPGIIVEQADEALLIARRGEHALQVRLLHRVLGFPEPMHQRRADGQDRRAAQYPAGDLRGESEAGGHFVDGFYVLDARDEAGGVMIAEIFAHRQIGDDGNAQIAQ